MKVDIRALLILLICLTGATALILWIVFSEMRADNKTIIYTISGLVVFLGLMALLYYKLAFQQIQLSKRLQKEGIAGTALITEVKDTGTTFSENPQILLSLEVKDSRGERYNASLLKVVSKYTPFIYQPGMTVAVKIDPENKMLVAIDETLGPMT